MNSTNYLMPADFEDSKKSSKDRFTSLLKCVSKNLLQSGNRFESGGFSMQAIT